MPSLDCLSKRCTASKPLPDPVRSLVKKDFDNSLISNLSSN